MRLKKQTPPGGGVLLFAAASGCDGGREATPGDFAQSLHNKCLSSGRPPWLALYSLDNTGGLPAKCSF